MLDILSVDVVLFLSGRGSRTGKYQFINPVRKAGTSASGNMKAYTKLFRRTYLSAIKNKISKHKMAPTQVTGGP